MKENKESEGIFGNVSFMEMEICQGLYACTRLGLPSWVWFWLWSLFQLEFGWHFQMGFVC